MSRYFLSIFAFLFLISCLPNWMVNEIDTKNIPVNIQTNSVICLSHLGFIYEHNKISDSSLATQTRFTDLIIGGHMQTFPKKPVVLKNSVGKPILINQVGWAALELGKIDFVFDRNCKVSGQLTLINNP
jgi:5'-nucleotidase